MHTASRTWIIVVLALCALAAYVALGLVAHGHGPFPIDTSAFALRGHLVGTAWFFTQLGLWPALLAVTAAGVLIAVRNRLAVAPVIALFLSESIGQTVLGFAKHGFNRARPTDYFGPHLHDLSYASGHAATAVVFYIGLAILAHRSSLPAGARTAWSTFLVLLGIAIMWSRLALGAHYLTDVMGGAVFGAGWLALSFALWPSVHERLVLPLERRYASRRMSAG